jgi:hypothetical protein
MWQVADRYIGVLGWAWGGRIFVIGFVCGVFDLADLCRRDIESVATLLLTTSRRHALISSG